MHAGLFAACDGFEFALLAARRTFSPETFTKLLPKTKESI
jgi:hypothetical protein